MGKMLKKIARGDTSRKELQTELEAMDDGTFQALLRYHLSVCEREDLIGATAHSLDICRKRQEASL